MRFHAAAGHLIGCTVEFIELSKRTKRLALVDELSANEPDTFKADALLDLGAVEAAHAIYAQRGELDGENSLSVCEDLIDQHDSAEARWHGLLDQWQERYNLALALFMQHRYLEAMAEFKACRAVYPHYRDILFFIDWIKAALPRGGAPFDPIAISMPVPRYSVVQAQGRPL